MWGLLIMKTKPKKTLIHENSVKNLIEIQTRPFEEAQALRIKGGSSSGENKSLARKLDWMKRKGMDDYQIRDLHDMLTNEDVSDLTILNYIAALKKMADDDGNFNKIRGSIDLLLKWRKERFGSKVNIQGNIKVDWGGDVDRILDACKVIDVEAKEVKENGNEN